MLLSFRTSCCGEDSLVVLFQTKTQDHVQAAHREERGDISEESKNQVMQAVDLVSSS